MNVAIVAPARGFVYDDFIRAINSSGFTITSFFISDVDKQLVSYAKKFIVDSLTPIALKCLSFSPPVDAGAEMMGWPNRNPRETLELMSKSDAIIALWDGESKRVASVVNTANKIGRKIFIYNKEENDDD